MKVLIDFFSDLFLKIIDYIKNDFNPENFIIALIAFLIIKFFEKILKSVNLKLHKRCEFNITGFWVARFSSFIYENREIIELYYIKQKSNKVAIRIYHYSNASDIIHKLYGKGEIRESVVSFYYTTIKKDSKTLGTAILRVEADDVDNLSLRGNCYEDFSKLTKKKQDEIHKIQKNDILVLKKISLPWYISGALILGIDVFKNYDAFEKRLKVGQ